METVEVIKNSNILFFIATNIEKKETFYIKILEAFHKESIDELMNKGYVLKKASAIDWEYAIINLKGVTVYQIGSKEELYYFINSL